MSVGVALGDCFLQLQKLENSMDKLRHVSEDITDVMQCIEQMGGIPKNNKKHNSLVSNTCEYAYNICISQQQYIIYRRQGAIGG